jgi:uncharacterized phage protein gp47/JayE
MSYGLTVDGFVRKRLQDIRDDLRTELEATFGPINDGEGSVFDKILGPTAEALSSVWELAEAVYFGLYPASAEGVQLDNVAQLVGLSRIAAGNSTAILAATGTQGTVVPASTDFSVDDTGEVFESDAAVTIDIADAINAVIDVDGVADNEDYTVTIGGTDHTIDSGGSATALSIAAALVSKINTDSTLMAATDNLDGSFYIRSIDLESGYSVAVSATGSGSLDITERASPIAVTATNTGPILGLAGTITVIDTPVAGLDSVTNYEDAIVGRDVETDVELRLRIQSARQGYATDEAIRSRLLDEVPGVSSVTIISNRTDVALPSSQPAHSYQAIVQGGADQDIADKLWEVQPSGIESFGTETETVVDSQGNNQTIKFSRPTNKYAWVKVVYTLHTEPPLFPDDGADAIKQAILDLGNTFVPGQDLLVQQMEAACWAVPGLQSVVVTIDVTDLPTDTPTYGSADIPTDPDVLLLFDTTRIPVAEAP